MSAPRRPTLIWFGFLVILVAFAAYYLLRGPSPSRSRPNILWITMDSLRGGHLGCSGYQRANTPTIDALAREAALFSQSNSQATYTRISVPSMITGKYPYQLGLRMMALDLDSSHVTLAEALLTEGYFTYAIAEPWRAGFYQGLEKLNKNNTSTLQKTRWCLETLDQLDDRPFFIWLYYWDPHAPYTPPLNFIRTYEPGYTWEENKPYSRPKNTVKNEDLRDPTGLYGGSNILLRRVNQGKIALTPAERDHLINLYDAEIAFVDSEIKQVLDKIKQLGLWDNTLVVLNADHGEAFGEHGRYFHGHTLYEEEVHVPLIVKPPGSLTPGKVIDGPVRNLDIMPTILDYCGIQAPAQIQGQSLRSFMEKDLSPDLPASIETHNIQTKTHLVSYRTGQHKLIYNLSRGGTQLYDLIADPGEKNNLLAREETPEQNQGPAARLEIRLREKLLQSMGVETLADLKLKDKHLKIDPKTREQLKTLGYIY